MKKSSKIRIIISNCLSDGSSFLENEKNLEQVIRDSFANLDNMFFTGVSSNVVRGNHNSFTISIEGVMEGAEPINLPGFIRKTLNDIQGFYYSEARIEYTRIWDVQSEAARIIKELYGITIKNI
jgi:hypothetical protein